MKIFFDSQDHLGLAKFGIDIPLTDSRVSIIRSFLNKIGCEALPIDRVDSYVSLDPQLLSLAHSPEYVQAVFGDTLDVEKTLCKTFELYDEAGKPNRYDPKKAVLPLARLAKHALQQAAGTLAAARWTQLNGGGVFYLGGGFHHGMSFGGRGFCYVNDIVIAANKLLESPDINQIWVIDIDAHKGDGTAELCRNNSAITTLSIHMAEGWPLDSAVDHASSNQAPWFIPSDIDIPINDSENDQYNDKLSQGLHSLEKMNQPDYIMVVHGSDPYEKDQLPSSGKLNLTLDQMLERDMLVYKFAKKFDVPFLHLLAGGYGVYAHEPYNHFFHKLSDMGELD